MACSMPGRLVIASSSSSRSSVRSMIGCHGPLNELVQKLIAEVRIVTLSDSKSVEQ